MSKSETFRPPLSVVGGKSRIADRIVRLLPEHTTYVEPYAGGARVFWKKPPSEREVLNDLDGEVMAVYRFLQAASDADLEAFSKRNWRGSEALYDQLTQAKGGGLTARAYRMWYVSRFGFLGAHSDKGNFMHVDAGLEADVSLNRLQKLRDRLRDVALLSGDALAVIRKHTSPDTVFYLDPPYPAGRSDDLYAENEQGLAHFKELVSTLRRAKGQFILSCNKESLDLVDIPRSWHVKRIGVPYMYRSGHRLRYELLVMNFEPKHVRKMSVIKSREAVLMADATREYLESLLKKAKELLPDWLYKSLHRAALPSAGGKARWREPEEPSFLEKMALSDIRPEKLKDAPNDEVRLAWLRLAQWYGAAKKRGEAVEGVVNAALWTMSEFDRRGWTYEDSDLVQEARKLRDVKKAEGLEAKLAKLPAEVVLVPNFVCVVGSAATGKEKPGDIDVLVRASRDSSEVHYLIQSDNVWLPVRKVLDPDKKGNLHFIDSPQGSHADFIPCYSLVLRHEEPKRQVVKGGGTEGGDGQASPRSARETVPGTGPTDAQIMFVGASPSAIEAARKEPLVGPSGLTFKERYLQPLGLSRESAFITNAVGAYLADDKGNVREPTPEEVEEWKSWLTRQFDEVQPHIVVALGQTAKAALGDRADFTLPHPTAVRRFGDSGELSRKLKQIKGALAEVRKADDEGETTAEAASKFWADNWFRMFPPDGKGRFVYQHHWRGLSEDESNLDEKELLGTSHSLHSDMRFEADGELWGFSVFLGTTEQNRGAGGDRLMTLPEDDNLQGQFKLAHPKAWLRVGVGRPMVTEPGGVGSTSEKYSKFFAADSGTYEIGCWREHMLELFLHGDKLKGRFLIEYAPVGGRRVWLIDKPKDQTPYAKSHKLPDVISELKTKGQKHLVWRDPEERGKPRLIDVESGRVAKEYFAQILKADDEKQIVYGVVLEPETVDTQGDVMAADEIEKAAHKFLVRSRVIGDRHSKKAGAEVVESYVAPVAFELGGQKVKQGSWILGVHVTDARLWRDVKSGEYRGFSVGGYGVRQEVA